MYQIVDISVIEGCVNDQQPHESLILKMSPMKTIFYLTRGRRSSLNFSTSLLQYVPDAFRRYEIQF